MSKLPDQQQWDLDDASGQVFAAARAFYEVNSHPTRSVQHPTLILVFNCVPRSQKDQPCGAFDVSHAMEGEESKNAVAMLIDRLSQRHELVVLIFEAWVVREEVKHVDDAPEAAAKFRGVDLSTIPGCQEELSASFSFKSGLRALAHAPLIRDPKTGCCTLGAVSQIIDHLSGRFMGDKTEVPKGTTRH